MGRVLSACVGLAFSVSALFAGENAAARKPLLRDFLGVCGHTVLFRPKLYRPLFRLVRDYHGLKWDVGGDTSFKPTFPFARNRVDWNKVYGSWKAEGFETDVSIMFGKIPPGSWKDLPRDARAYGKAFAKFFGPSAKKPLVACAEIGNEPGSYDDAAYRKLFEQMAKGLREGDPKLTIATCAATPGKSGKYAKSLKCVKGLESWYDVINLHVYAQIEGWPTWKRSYPEDPKIDYLKKVQRTIAWRDANAPGKPLWITEFGWDASTKPPPAKGAFAKWQGNTETQQARYLVRSTLVFMKMPVARAYIYFFNDRDEPHVHGSSGLTRNYRPKPAYHAVAHLQKTLGPYRFLRALKETAGKLYVFEFVHGADPARRILAAWSPTGSNRRGTAELPLKGWTLEKAERMPLKPGAPAPVTVQVKGGVLTIPYDESPLYLFLRKAASPR